MHSLILPNSALATDNNLSLKESLERLELAKAEPAIRKINWNRNPWGKKGMPAHIRAAKEADKLAAKAGHHNLRPKKELAMREINWNRNPWGKKGMPAHIRAAKEADKLAAKARKTGLCLRSVRLPAALAEQTKKIVHRLPELLAALPVGKKQPSPLLTPSSPSMQVVDEEEEDAAPQAAVEEEEGKQQQQQQDDAQVRVGQGYSEVLFGGIVLRVLNRG